MERNDKILSRKIDDEIKKYSLLQTLFTKIVETETCKIFLLTIFESLNE